MQKSWKGQLAIALIYPNTYSIGISNLGFQTVYRLLNEMDDVICERFFLPEKVGPIRSVESERPLTDFDILAFSISFENDFIHVLTIFRLTGIPFFSIQRNQDYPLVLAGGVACFLNPEPIAPVVDIFLLGEAEEFLSEFVNIAADVSLSRQDMLLRLAHEVKGAYVPGFYHLTYHADRTIRSMEA
ncbi:MAG TPA: radical SAM protein, partial [Desulfatirhabdiaceae bacterium]|nr:radical SAM protein [Desulfatirhabdiaceae bacterium]